MNMFTLLKKGGKENYVTRSFAILLNEIPNLARYLFNKFLGEKIESENFEIKLFESLKTGANKTGTIDMVIKLPPFDIYIENKVESGLSGKDQLVKYNKYIHQQHPNNKLILISKWYIEDKSVESLDNHLYWSKVYDFIEKFYKERLNLNAKEMFLIEQFLEFLKEENMSSEKVSWEYAKGAKSFLNLLKMLESIFKDMKKNKEIKSMGDIGVGVSSEYAGFYFEIYGERQSDRYHEFWIGVYHNELEKIYLEILTGIRKKFKKVAFEKFPKSYGKNPAYEFDFQKEHFLALSKEEQENALKNFAVTSLKDLDNRLKGKN